MVTSRSASCLELQHEFPHRHADHLGIEMRERNDGVEPVAEFRRELAIDRLVVVPFPLVAREAERLTRQVGITCVTRKTLSSPDQTDD
jgi:hypothetical protein